MALENTKQRMARINRELATSLTAFNNYLDEAVKVAKDHFIDLHRLVALEALRLISMRTPVDTGRARGNWTLNIGKVPRPLTGAASDNARAQGQDAEASSPSAAGVTDIITEADKTLRKLGFGSTVWVSNNLEYVMFLEDGSSTQAPKGMVRVTLEDLKGLVRNVS